jgi:hypothetical protein
MNPNKCSFGVSAGQFLGFMVYERGIEVGQKSMKAIDKAIPPTNKNELQYLLGKINFIRRFISNLSERILPFSPLLKLKNNKEFKWGDVQQKAFKEIKEYMKSPPVLVPPQQGKPSSCMCQLMAKQLDRPLCKNLKEKKESSSI